MLLSPSLFLLYVRRCPLYSPELLKVHEYTGFDVDALHSSRIQENSDLAVLFNSAWQCLLTSGKYKHLKMLSVMGFVEFWLQGINMHKSTRNYSQLLWGKENLR